MEERQNSLYRYERKFVLASNRLNGFLASLYNQNYFEQYHERRINNIYYDDYNFSSVSENLDGLSQRKKYRVRWYGKQVEKTNKTLEIKVKNEFMNHKINVKLGPLMLNNLYDINTFNNDILQSLNKRNEYYYYNLLLRKRPTLFNSYQRIYFQNHYDDIRLTIDSDLYFFSPITNLNLREKNIIIEAKFNRDVNFLNKFKHLSLTRYSKYVKGQVNLENKLSSKANKILFLDTNIITTINWSITHFDGYCDPWIIKQTEFLKYHHYLITNIDIPWVKDDLRDSPNERDSMLSSLINQHDIRGLKYSIISGDKDLRKSQSIDIIKNLI